MTVIDKISFRFGMADEQFAKELYADWDGFCQRCVTDILEEFFFRYDRKEVYIEIDRLDLNLGSISQEEFYELFPVRLREALEQSFTGQLNERGVLQAVTPDNSIDAKVSLETEKSSLYAQEKRFGNLLHYLEYGFCLPEWDMLDFDLYEELLYFNDKKNTEGLLSLFVSKPYIMERLFLQTGTERLAELMPFAAWLSSPTLGQYEKQRYLTAVLERAPQTVIRFIHRTKDTGSIEGMAELLENPHIRRIMAAETERHAEIDVPEYWYRLYGWLLEYYPFNGVPMFGDKLHFRLHLNRSLLSFIRKRDYQTYLSKAQLTMQFLLEVFGADYCMMVLNIIYHNQRLNADGSPASGDSYVWELYYMLLQLSLLKTGQSKAESADVQAVGEKSDELSPYSAASVALREPAGSFGEWLEDTEVSDGVKRKSLLRLAKEHPEWLVRWLKNRPERRYLSLLATFTDEPSVLLLAGQVSLQLTEAVADVSDMLDKACTSVSWLKGTGSDQLTAALNTVVLEGIGAGTFPPSDSVPMLVLRIVELLYKEITGTDASTVTDTSAVADASDTCLGASEVVGVAELTFAGGSTVPNPIREFIGIITMNIPSLTVIDDIPESTYRKLFFKKEVSAVKTASSLQMFLSDSRISDGTKKMLVLQWFDTYRGQESEWIPVLQSKELLEKIIDLLGDIALRHIIMRLVEYVFRVNGLRAETSARQFIGLLVENIETVAGLVSRSVKNIWLLLVSSIASGNGDSVTGLVADRVGFAVRLLSAIADNDGGKVAIEFFIRQFSYTALSIETSERKEADEKQFFSGFEKDALLSLLIRMQEYIRSEKQGAGILKADTNKKNRMETDKMYSNLENGNSSIRIDNMGASKVQMVFEQQLNEVAGIIEWLRNETFTSIQKREVICRYVGDYPKEAIHLIQETIALDENASALWTEFMGEDTLMDMICYMDNRMSNILGPIIRAIETISDRMNLIAGSTEEQSISIAKVLVLLIAEKPDWSNMNAGEIARLFLSYWHYVLTGSKEYTDTDREKWETAERQIIGSVVSGIETVDSNAGTVTAKGNDAPPLASSVDQCSEEVFDDWMTWFMSPSVSDTAKSQMLRHYARWQPELLWRLVRHSADGGVGKAIPFRQWSGWLGTDAWLEMISGVSLSLSETLRRATEAISEKYSVTESVLAEGMVRFVIDHPMERIYYGDASSIVRKYLSILDPLAWKDGMPAPVHEQVAITDDSQSEHRDADKISLSDEQCTPVDTTNRIAGTSGSEVEKQLSETDRNAVERQLALDNLIKEVESQLHITDAEQLQEEAIQPEYLEIPNAGLCLLAIWLSRLFGMLGLLTEDKKDLKDTEARIRAIFILQRLVTDEMREYKEQDLAFNRILTGCPFYVALPKTLELTDSEIQTIESMLNGAKANWGKLKNTSVKGFQRSFIERPGRLEQREEKWVLYVEDRSYDILLDSLPWSYRQIRLPWLKKKINVVWRDKEEFDFENHNN